MQGIEFDTTSMACPKMLYSHESVHGVPDDSCQPTLSSKLYEFQQLTSCPQHDDASGCPQHDDAYGTECCYLTELEDAQHTVFSINGKKRLVHAATHVSLAKEYDENITEAESKCHRSIKIAEEALDNVLRNEALHPREKLRMLESLCSSPEGWIVAWALRGNGWNPGTGRMEMQPHAACYGGAVDTGRVER
jgi:hypothetical protein